MTKKHKLTAVEVLKKARYNVREPKRWVQGARSVQVGEVRCYCLFGAVDSVETQYAQDSPAWAALKQATIELYGAPPIEFNDRGDTTHRMILAALDRAIEVAGKSS